MQAYEKPNVEKIFLRPKKATVAGPEFSESSWSGSSCFSICRLKARGKQPDNKASAIHSARA